MFVSARRNADLFIYSFLEAISSVNDTLTFACVIVCVSGGSVWKMSGERDRTPWTKKRRAPVLCALFAVLLCCLQSGASVPGE